MIRTFRIGLSNILSASLRTSGRNPCVTQAAQYSSGGDYSIVIDKDTGLERFENDEEFDARYEAFFNNPKIDGWEIRKGMTDMHGMDLVPEPKIIIAALKACRRVNDYALAVRYLEAIQNKGIANKDIWPYILQQINPTLEELGIFTPAQMGYDRPELALKQVYDMHGKDSD